MITIIAFLWAGFSIFLSAFISFNPNFHYLIEKNFMRRAYSNATHYGLQYGQLGVRAGTISTSNTEKTLDIGYLKKIAGEKKDKMVLVITLEKQETNNYIDVDAKHKFLKE